MSVRSLRRRRAARFRRAILTARDFLVGTNAAAGLLDKARGWSWLGSFADWWPF